MKSLPRPFWAALAVFALIPCAVLSITFLAALIVALLVVYWCVLPVAVFLALSKHPKIFHVYAKGPVNSEDPGFVPQATRSHPVETCPCAICAQVRDPIPTRA